MMNKKTSGLLFSVLFTFTATSTAFAGVKVAFTGDQGIDEDAQAVLSLIANEGTDLLMIQGDLAYEGQSPYFWEGNLNNFLGRDFPVLTLVGNHESEDWELYEDLIGDRIDRVGDLSCSGRVGVKANCRYKNIDIVQVAPAIYEVPSVPAFDDYHGFIRSSFSGSNNNRWRICAWHKNQRNLQTGRKNNSTGWDVYNACLDAGAIVAVAHQHSYSRTHLLSSFENQSVVHRNNVMRIAPGNSMMFVSGLGGKSIREQTRGGDWWGSIYTASQGATHGALFCDFGTSKADCYFKAIDGSVPDRFTLTLGGSSSQPAAPAPQNPEPVAAKPTPAEPSDESGSKPGPVSEGYVFSRTDKDEYRWIDNDDSGHAGNVWIDKACAQQLGGAAASGDWDELQNRAPGFDTIAYPCDGSTTSTETSGTKDPDPLSENPEGYVFSRTDKNEYRWVGPDGSGSVASVWIDEACSDSFGGPIAYGDWDDLMARAPEFDAIDSPCIGGTANPGTLDVGGFVFARTDINEYRWVDRHDSGELGNIWIDEDCARRMGKPAKSGDWYDLNEVAPAFDAIASPCQ
ncbi:MAG: metallophosphoesterase [Gammaproteobacteria bacterium]|nr:metallophosphoesterase [Gammaproteobacteria bacterium]